MSAKRGNKKLGIICTILCTAILLSIAVWEFNERANEEIVFTEYYFPHADIPEEFDGYKLMVISDLHNAPFSKQIINYASAREVDAILFTGDMVQLPDCNTSEAEAVAREFKRKIPMYAISGNHETQNAAYGYICDSLRWEGVEWLENRSAVIEKDGSEIKLVGVKDPRHNTVSEDQQAETAEFIKEELDGSDMFSIVLNHRANLYPAIKNSGADLIISGHLHGGVVRLPFVGGIVGEHGVPSIQKYEYGLIKEGDASPMIVSGGCDKNPEKKRWFNRPEAVIIILESE